MTPDQPSPALAADQLLQAVSAAGQPDGFYSVLAEVLQEAVGYVFATLFVVHRGETLRVFSTEAELYPVGVRKPMGPTPWGDLVIGRRQSILATDNDGVRRWFFDHEKIRSLGCGSTLSVPVVYDATCLGSLNLNHREHFYTHEHLRATERLAPCVVPVLLATLRRLDEA